MTTQTRSLFREQCFIGGHWCSATNNASFHVYNPSTKGIVGSVPYMGSKETAEAIKLAEQAFKTWKAQTAALRARVLRRWYQLIVQHTEELAYIISREQGKPIKEARGEVEYAASFVEWFAEEARRSYGDVIPSHRDDARILTLREPIGVVAAITPWNFPAAMVTRKCAPAFAAGCAVILKPAPETPFTALALADLAHQAGIPSGLFSVITGDNKAIGKTLLSSPIVRKLSFTGSTLVGKELMQQAASSIKKLSLELGGNAPFIIFDDADIDAAIDGIMIAKFRNAGQTCVCANRIYVHDSVYEEVTKKLVDRVAQLKVGDAFEPNIQIGPLINRRAVDKVITHVNDALALGAEVAFGKAPSADSNFFTPYVLTEVSDDMLIAHEETFGPVAALFRFQNEHSVLERANRGQSGLCAYIYTRSLSRAWRVSEALETGIVGVNEGLISTTVAPFGGVKESGLGREGSYQGLEEYQEVKYVLMGGI
ncbi:succinate-semialdehyde dehydrogenase (NADP(+)) [Vibrio ponticus]|uniref:Succinate-semialdehyde dehydrogenase (NADP(+)) n=1 Tax=Vibrio ponticus TaxID=265668 RepID=A0ABX3FA80_9VIBR|nr:NAD-dependent succinate-semialdehyde dehydrogenase [Vibrio ponticus]OLQ87840.1 succinate-semialdehyde dehydrogenase (NADP(+)) [Vibrio ponticus]